jgi:sec-independent protein translocase protein TatB
MNIFSNLGITELILILLLALLVVGPERLPELGRKLGKILRDVRTAYDNLTSDLGPELASFQQTAKELRDSVDSVRNIPQDMVKTVVKSAELDDTLDELKGVRDSVGQMTKTLSDAQKVVSNPVSAAVDTARSALSPGKASLPEASAVDTEGGQEESAARQGSSRDQSGTGTAGGDSLHDSSDEAQGVPPANELTGGEEDTGQPTEADQKAASDTGPEQSDE